MSTVSERFGRLPEQQEQRQVESSRQAREASELLERLRATRRDAERLAIAEIAHTKRLQKDELVSNPDLVKKRAELASAEQARRDLDQSLTSIQNEETRILQDMAMARKDEESRGHLLKKLRDLEDEKAQALPNEENGFLKEIERLKRVIRDVESGMAKAGNIDESISRLEFDLSALNSREAERQKSLDDYKRQRSEAQRDLTRAETLLSEAKAMYKDQLHRLQQHPSSVSAFEEAVKAQQQAKEQLVEIEEHANRDQLEKQMLSQQIESIKTRINALNEKIYALQNEVNGLNEQLRDFQNRNADIDARVSRWESDKESARINLERAQALMDRAADLDRTRIQSEAELSGLEADEKRAEDAMSRARIMLESLDGSIRDTHDDMAKLNDRRSQLVGDLFRLRDEKEKQAANAQEHEGLRNDLNHVQSNWTTWVTNRRSPLLQAIDNVKKQLGQFKDPTFAESLQHRFEQLQEERRRLENSQHARHARDVGRLRADLDEAESQLRLRLVSPQSNLSPRFTRQLEIEAEAIMRAEAAAALEKKQEAIEKETRELSALRLAHQPRVMLDEEAKGRMWGLNSEAVEDREIAKKVIELCQARNIKVEQ